MVRTWGQMSARTPWWSGAWSWRNTGSVREFRVFQQCHYQVQINVVLFYLICVNIPTFRVNAQFQCQRKNNACHNVTSFLDLQAKDLWMKVPIMIQQKWYNFIEIENTAIPRFCLNSSLHARKINFEFKVKMHQLLLWQRLSQYSTRRAFKKSDQPPAIKTLLSSLRP